MIASPCCVQTPLFTPPPNHPIFFTLTCLQIGEAAFMKTQEQAESLARAMVEVGRHLNVDVRALLTEMDWPIGATIGNALEVFEAVQCLNNEGPADLKNLVTLEGGHLLHQAGLAATPEEGAAKIAASLEDGTARDAFKKMCVAVGTTPQDADKLFEVSDTVTH